MNDNEKTISADFPLTDDILSPTDDYIFKLLFGSEGGIDDLTKVLKSVLRFSDDDYSEITIIDPHLIREHKDDKLGILDVKVQTKSGELVNVEIQVKPSPELRERVTFYTAKMLAGQIKSGDKYSKIKRVVSIIITDHILIQENNTYHNRYTLYDPKTGSEFSNVMEIHSIELPKSPLSDDGTELWWWTKFLSAKSKEEFIMLANQNPQVKNAVVRLMELSADERTRMINESIQKRDWDNRAREDYARKQGRAEGRAEIARNLVDLNVPIEQIEKSTGLTRKEIEMLKPNLQ